MSFDSYSGPSHWESTNNKKNPFDTENNTSINDTSAFDDVNKSLGQVQDTSAFDTNKFNNSKGKFIYFNPEGLISTRKHKHKINKLVKKHLKLKYKIRKKQSNELKDLKIGIMEIKKKPYTINVKNKKRVNNVKEIDSELIEPNIGIQNGDKEYIKNNINKKTLSELIIESKKDIKIKEGILEKDKQHNLHISILRQQGNTKEQILKLINLNNKPKFIKYEKKYEVFGLNKKVVDTAISLVKNKDNLGAKHCTDWVNKIYIKVAGERVYDSHTLFNGVRHISKGTGIGVNKYASKKIISNIKPGDHIMVDKPVNGKYGVGKTHSLIALDIPKDGLIRVASYSGFGSDVKIEEYDLYGLDRANDGKPIRIQTV